MDSSRIEKLHKSHGLKLLETLYMICTIGEFGGRGPLKAEHIPRFLVLGEQELNVGVIKSVEEEVRMNIPILTSEKIVSQEPELRCLLDEGSVSQLKQTVEAESRRRLPVRNLAFYVFESVAPERSRWVTLSSSDSSFRGMLMGVARPDYGLYVKIIIEPMVFTGILRAGSDAEASTLRTELLQRARPLEEEGILRVRCVVLPLHAISLFPMNTAVAKIDRRHRHASAARYFARAQTQTDSPFRLWYEDYLRELRDIVNHVPDLDMVLGGMMMGRRAVVAHDPNSNRVSAVEFISSEEKDAVEFRIGSIGSFSEAGRTDKISNRWLIREMEFAWKEGMFDLQWDHPYLRALDEIQRILRDLRLDRPRYDASTATDKALQEWIESEISELRSLSEKLDLREELDSYVQPIHAYVAYALDEARPSWVRDGVIIERFYTAKSDQILVRNVPTRGDAITGEIFERAFPSVSEPMKPFLESISGLLYYLGPILGDPYSTI
jgi:hypothetical protein